MKKIYHLVLVLFALFSITIFAGCGNSKKKDSDTPAEAFKYDINKAANTVIIKGLKDMSISKIVIPSKIEGCLVTMIAENAFESYVNITEVVIRDGLTSIEASAFANCTNLTSILIPNSVKVIGKSAFNSCCSLKNFTIGNGLTRIRNEAFENCSGLKNIYYGGTIENWCNITFADIYSNPMYYAKNFYILDENGNVKNNKNKYSLLETIEVPNTIETIDDYQFYGFNNVTSITIPNSVTSIGSYAFTSCVSLVSVTIGSGVTNIGEYAFSGCHRLVEIYNLSSLDITTDSYGYGFIGTFAKVIHTSLDESSIITKTSDEYLFMFYEEEYYLLGYVGDSKELVLPNDINGQNYQINDCAFYNCDSLISVIIPNSVTVIGEYAFNSCKNLISVTINDGIKSLGLCVFTGCSKLVEIYNLSSNNITAGSSDYSDLAWRAKIVHTSLDEESIITKTSDGYSFMYYKNEYYLLGYLGDSKELVLPSNINGQNYKIYSYAFYNCDSLTSVTIPNGVTGIDFNAFDDCGSLTSIVIPNSVTRIGDRAFYNCINLTRKYYNGSQTDWSSIEIREPNSELRKAKIYYYSETQPTDTDYRYWYYDSKGNIVIW